MRLFLRFCRLPDHRPLVEIYVLICTSLPIMRHLLYFIFKHDGHFVDADTQARICQRYGLPTYLVQDDLESLEAPDLMEEGSRPSTGSRHSFAILLDLVHWAAVMNCLKDLSGMMLVDSEYVQELQMVWPDNETACILSRRSFVGGGARVWWVMWKQGPDG